MSRHTYTAINTDTHTHTYNKINLNGHSTTIQLQLEPNVHHHDLASITSIVEAVKTPRYTDKMHYFNIWLKLNVIETTSSGKYCSSNVCVVVAVVLGFDVFGARLGNVLSHSIFVFNTRRDDYRLCVAAGRFGLKQSPLSSTSFFCVWCSPLYTGDQPLSNRSFCMRFLNSYTTYQLMAYCFTGTKFVSILTQWIINVYVAVCRYVGICRIDYKTQNCSTARCACNGHFFFLIQLIAFFFQPCS